ncbi:MAG: riboflavin synthase subunit alpha [Myxococcales bacterium]|jgi:riboflavin synthase
MFTGITRGTFPVTRIEREPGLLRYAVALPERLREGLELGASVSIDGVCQTVVAVEGEQVRFDAIQETLDKTTLGELREGSLVSVERSFRVGDEVGGHEVSGHVRGTGAIASIEHRDQVFDLRVTIPREWMKYVMQKGFIAVDGSSLTVGKTDPDGAFDLHLIPETLRLTKFGRKKVGDRVNIELDARTVAIVDTVERVLAERAKQGGA